MARVRAKARIGESSITAGNGPFALAGAFDASHNRFSSIMAVGDTTTATVVEPGVAFWSGIVTYSAANEITLTTVEETKGTFGAGTKEIFAGQLASRSMLAEDIAGAIVTGGSSTAYTVASNRVYDTLSRLDGNLIAFTPHATNGQTVTLNVDGLGAKPLRSSPGVELMPGVLILGTPYMALYNHVSQVFYLHGLFGNPYNVPLAAGMDYWAPTAPNSAFVFPIGQQVSQTAYAALYALFGANRFGADGGGLFYLPDKTGRVSAMKEATASRLTTALGGVDGATLGAVGGLQTHLLLTAEIPSHAHANSVNDPGHAHNYDKALPSPGMAGNQAGYYGLDNSYWTPAGTAAAGTGISLNNANAGGGGAHKNVQPTIVCNYIMRVL
ncbi:MAG: tail fiber protein [Bradyrhizobium sp.]|uniref:tail fiber protein n=1 Tax=Bradyrhizobium sp. TaxID=376 RepID=UPI002730CAB4|nr:tail fiber protein [Bradyrhizobium sp.]MDP1867012.1 tail fiber protein [Bradyrhizobium sp.]